VKARLQELLERVSKTSAIAYGRPDQALAMAYDLQVILFGLIKHLIECEKPKESS
jgi:hypothetical protein